MPISDAELADAYRRVHRRLYNVLYRLLWSPQDCQDVMHDAFMRVWQGRDTVRIDTLDALVFSTALNLARNQLRWKSLRSFVGFDDELAGDGPGSDDLATVRRALAKLPVPQRQVLLLSEIGGFSTREIAGMLGVPEGTVGSRKHLALTKVRALLEEFS